MAENTDSPNVADFIEEEVEEEKHFHDLVTQQTSLMSGGTGMVHSATTDTLDSVYLDPPNPEHEAESDINLDLLNLDQNSEEQDQDGFIDEGSATNDGAGKIASQDEEKTDVLFSIEGETKDSKSESVPSLSKYFGKDTDQDDPFAADFLATMDELGEGLPTDIHKVGTDSSVEGRIGNTVNEMIDLTLNDTNDFLEEFEAEADMNLNNNQRAPDEANIESVDFDLALDKNDTVETPVDIEEEKDAFQSFTADIADTEALDALGMSPAAPSFMTEKNITDYFRQTSNQSDNQFNAITRQISQSSAKSVSSQDKNSLNLEEVQESTESAASIPTPVETSDVSIPAPDLAQQTSQPGVIQLVETVTGAAGSAETTPRHQPVFPPSTTLSPVDSPVHQSFMRQTSIPDQTNPEQKLTAFQTFPDSGVGDDPFAVTLQMSDSDRQHDAWLPSEATKNILITIATHAPGSYVADREMLCSPSLVITQPQGDPVRDLVYRYMGEQEALKRKVLTVDSVTPDADGLKQLMRGGCYRGAIDLTTYMLTEAGQDVAGETPTIHSPETLQLWYTRFSLMMKLRMYSILESEFVAFKNLDSPDIYYEFYPDQYPGKRGSMVPFGMRLLHAELPHHLGRSTETLDRYYYLLAISQKIQKNLSDGMSEDGSALTIHADSRKVSEVLWQEREKRLYYLIANVLVLLRDYDAALNVYEILLEKDCEHKTALLSGLGRIHLQIGNMTRAAEYFEQVKVCSGADGKSASATLYMNKGFEAMCQNNFTEAYQSFKLAVQADPSNTSAVNNMSVCCLYLGRLKEALKSLEALVHRDPDKNLHEGILFNLCTLYELESSRALHKKQALLDLVSKHKGDGFPVVCLKMA